MTDERLDELLDDAKRTWPVPPEPDYQAMWARIERDAFAGTRADRRMPSWRVVSLGLAATLMMGVALGRMSVREPAAGPDVAATTTDTDTPGSNPYDRVASELLGRTVVLLTSLPTTGTTSVVSSERFATQAIELLTNTRLLLDSPAASDARFKDLLEDLELVLAQVAMLQSGRSRQEIDLITDALEERDVVPRIRSAAARFATGD